ncbi:pentatricopeptide repeat protein, putative [Bodo saltans]|uniref:Pentatricopeptide repeat protein, putative n=1 Tax=Bodo saltans TaxID=75058 RepID=A0A0S4JES4_BODSA|nr:pentatricopeptide repeat protein, putative [Bodo saltans]|eukprot:CUG88539.1 pentatricopeptide repeat protein, putative [Bodo saltans]
MLRATSLVRRSLNNTQQRVVCRIGTAGGLFGTTPLRLNRHTFQTFSQQDEDDLVRVIKTKPKHVLKHVRQQVWRSRKKELHFRNTVTQLMIVVQDHLRKQLLDPNSASAIMEGVLEECVKFGQHDMAHLLFRAFLRFRKYGCNITIDALRYLFESYKETDSSELMLQLANEMKADPSLRALSIAAYLFAGATESAEALRANVIAEEMTADDFIAVAEGYAKLHQVDKLNELIKSLPRKLATAPGSSSAASDEATSSAPSEWIPVFQCFLRLCVKLNDELLFAQVFHSATDRKITFTQDMFATILRLKVRNVTSVDELVSIEEELKGLGYVADITTNSIIISAFARLTHFGDRGSEEVILAKVDTLLSTIEARLKQGDPDADVSAAHIRAVIRGYGAAGRPELIKSAWARIQHKDLTNNTRIYNEVIKWFALMGNVKDVLELKDEMQGKGLHADAQTYAWIFRALGKFYPRHTERLYQEMRSQGTRPDVSLYTSLIGIFADLEQMERVEEILKEMQGRVDAGTLQFTSNTFAVLIRVYGVSDLPRAELFFREALEKGHAEHSHVQTAMLNAYAKRGDEAAPQLEAFVAALPAWTIDTYNVLINMYGRRKNKEKVLELFEKLKAEQQVQMNDVTFGTLVTAFARMKDTARVHEVVELLKVKEGTVSASFYSVLAASLHRMGDTTGVNDAWEDLQASKLFPDTEVYNQFLSLYGRQHNTAKVQTVLDSMMRHVPPNPVTSTTVLDLLGKTGRIYEMEALFEDMKKSTDAQPTAVTYHQVLNAFAKTGDVVKMDKLRQEMATKGIKENAVTYNILADGFGRAKRFEQLNELLQQRKTANIPMDELGYCVLIAAYGRAKLPAELHRIATELKVEEGASKCVTNKVIWAFIDAHCRCNDIAGVEVWEGELASLAPEKQLTASQQMVLLGYHCRLGAMDKVDAAVQRIEESGQSLSYGALNAIAKGYSKAGLFEKTVGVLHKMRDRNFVPDSATTLVLSGAFLKAGLHEQAQQIVEWRRQYAKHAGADESSA